MLVTKTKIICTIGPAVNTVEKMIRLMEGGMNAARLNFSHGSYEDHEIVINNLKKARAQKKMPLAIILDTKGPEIRIGKITEGQIDLRHGQLLNLFRNPLEGSEQGVCVHPSYVLNDLSVGTRILFDDGYISSHVIESTAEKVVVKIDNGGALKSGKGVNIPNARLNLPTITEKDIADIHFGCKHDVDVIAASFVRSPEHVLAIKRLLTKEKKPDIQIYAKIENKEGVQNFDSIVQIADGIMIARGDLGVEVPLSEVPRLQKMMIRKSYLAGKPVVTATQMLESMINNPRPTRAEASDVANAVYDSTSSVMLSGETAIGKYPFETVQVMRSIVQEAEADFNYRAFFDFHSGLIHHDVPSAVTLATVKTAYSSRAKAIFAFTSGGSTACLLSRLRPEMPIIAMTSHEKCYHQMALSWGVRPYLSSQPTKTISEAFTKISTFALKENLVSNGDLVVVTAGSPFGISGTTNMMMVESIGDVLVRGHHGVGSRVHGNVTLVLSSESAKDYAVRGQLLVMTKCDPSFLSLIQESIGIILQNHIDDVESEKSAIHIAQLLDKPAIVRADEASRILKEGQLVTLDPEKALVYKGVIF
ncbi:pyruvate kinase [Neochlamydia sp. S13]|uniref:pyruvate kinase n=1 Tax=Neochlamydia sp. S13 TaxID=1353976 RepID=UPI000A4751EF|nr:pyruvate kinase [Neochlamydia sp. S13]BBI17433.1 pyruvate kinase [Neochlamydia sp. S13]